MANIDKPKGEAEAWFRMWQDRAAEAQRRKEAEALAERQRVGENAALVNRAALTVGAAQAQTYARSLADAALAAPAEKAEVVTGSQLKRKRPSPAIRI